MGNVSLGYQRCGAKELSPDIQLASQPHRLHFLEIKHAGQVRQLFLRRRQRLHRGPVLLSRAEYQIKIASFDGIGTQQPGRLREPGWVDQRKGQADPRTARTAIPPLAPLSR